MLKIAKDNEPTIKFIESDVCDLPQDLDKDFDGVLIAYVIQHLSKEETKETFINLNKYLKTDCKLLILFRAGDNVLTENEPFDPRFNYVIKEYNVEEITQLLRKCGYEVIEIEEKPYKDDENSLCPTTLVLYARKC